MPSKNDIRARLKKPKAIQLAEGDAVPTRVQLMAPGVYNHPFFGIMRITQQTFSDMVTNWQNNVRGQELPMDYGHDTSGPASGWIKQLLAQPDGLWADVEWTPAAQQGIADKEWAYISADFYFQWEDPATGMLFDNVLNGAALVNSPFIKNMEAVAQFAEGTEALVLSELTEKEINEREKMKTAEQLNGEIAQLSEKVKTSEGELAALKTQLSERDAAIASLKGEKAAILAEKEKSDKKAKFAELCRDGKAVAAQEEAFLAGDLVKFAELSKAANTNPAEKGEAGGAGAPAGAAQLSEVEKATCRQLNISEADYIKYNK